MTDEQRRQRGLDKMSEVYGWEFQDGPGDFFGYTADHLFADIWSRPGLDTKERRLLLVGMLAAQGATDVLEIQLGAAHRNGELDAEGAARDRGVPGALRRLARRRAAEQRGGEDPARHEPASPPCRATSSRSSYPSCC